MGQTEQTEHGSKQEQGASASTEAMHAGIEEIEATREAYATEALLTAVADVVALYRGGGAELPPRLPALDRLAAAYESYTRLSSVYTPDAAAGSGQPPTT